jgi:hypothetical protein
MTTNEMRDFIQENIGERAILEQLAEEAAELSQAALKAIRAAGYSNNPTPVTAEKACDIMFNELLDVLCVYYVLGGKEDGENYRLRLERWVQRIQEVYNEND